MCVYMCAQVQFLTKLLRDVVKRDFYINKIKLQRIKIKSHCKVQMADASLQKSAFSKQACSRNNLIRASEAANPPSVE